MSEELKYIDNLFKETLSDNKVASTPANIKGASKLIGKFNFLHFSFSTFNIYYTILIILLTVFSVFYFTKNNSGFAELMKSKDIAREDISFRAIIIPVDTLDIEPIALFTNDNVHETKTTVITEKSKEKIIPLDIDTITAEEDINSKQDTMVIYKRIVIADTVRTIIYQKVKPKKNQKKD